MKKIISALLAFSMVFGLTSCAEDESVKTTDGEKTQVTDNAAENTESTQGAVTFAPEGEYMKNDSAISEDFLNFNAPEEGEEIIVMSIKGFGDVKIQLFPEVVPLAVENFVTHAKDGYYDGLTFHRVIGEFMIQGGDPLGTGTGGESIWGEKFDSGMTSKLHHFTGALAYANSGSTYTSGSQFYICVNKAITEDEMKEYYNGGYTFDEATQKKYVEVGGQPFLDKGIFAGPGTGYTVFGQVFEGQDVIEAVSKVETDGGDKPVQGVIIESVKVEQYHK
ncbi:MAG: peptidylprolyl isomerase [Oscillospiraceae bacterium]|nr:peptidylprolyl isomerase [Oscillospiraceae bacterium]